jgi:hypothetical protein
MRSALRPGLAMLMIIGFILLASEALYRIYLYFDLRVELAEKYKLPQRNEFWAWGVEPWVFDQALGYNYNKKAWRLVNIKNDMFDGCEIVGKANKYGNVGDHRYGTVDVPDDLYDNADIKVIIVGSSFSQSQDAEGDFVNKVLGRQLSQHLHRSVDVLNFSRDATGVLSYTDVARETIRTLHPNVVLMLINTPGLLYRRLWRTVAPDESGNLRFIQMLSPDATFSDHELAFLQVRPINHDLTPEWCAKMEAAKARGDLSLLRSDALVLKLIREYERQLRDATVPKIAVNFWRLDVSFVYNLLKKGDPFAQMTKLFATPQYSPYYHNRYSDDPQFTAVAAELRQSGIPVIPVHIPAYKEMVDRPNGGFEFAACGVAPAQGGSLVADLQSHLGQRWIELYEFYPSELKTKPLELVQSEQDSHPSPLGVQAMADALEIVLRTDPRTAPMFRPALTTDATTPN